MYHLNSIKKIMRALYVRLLTIFIVLLLVVLVGISSTVSAFASDISGRSNAALAVVNEVSLSFTVVSDTETAGHSTIELWSGLNTTDGNASDDTNKIPVNNGKAILPQAGEGDVYTYRISADGCYTVTCSFTLSKQDVLLGKKEVKIELQKRSGRGYEASAVRIWSEEIEKKLFGTNTLNNVDISILDTPAFDSDKAAHAFTTLTEGKVYLKRLCAQSDHTYLYYLDSEKTWPVVIFTQTDLKGVSSLKKALAAIDGDGRTKVLYQAQIHGNEPAAGEGALTVAKALSGQTAVSQDLAQLDVVMVPYANRYGSEHFVRAGTASGINLNRDALALRAADTKLLHQLFVSLMPEVFIDGHEFSYQNKVEAQDEDGTYLRWLDDIQLTCVNNLNREPGIFETEESMAAKTRQLLKSKGFRTYAYDASCNSTTWCNFARLYNCYTFLVESGGIGMGKSHFDRRVLAQYETVTSLLQQAASNGKNIQTSVSAARKALTQRGSKYSLTDKFVLQHGIKGSVTLTMDRLSFDLSGEIWGSLQQTDVFYNTDSALRQRSRPTAYLIDKGASGAAKAKSILVANGAKCFQLPKNSKVEVRQYSGTKTKAIIGKKKQKTFKNGAYVFVMNQEAANIISASLEPDTTDTAGYKGSFVQAGILKKSGGTYPIYRYEKKNPEKSLKR